MNQCTSAQLHVTVIEYFEYLILNEAFADLKFPVGLKFSFDCYLGSEIRWIITMNVSLLSSVIPCIWAWFQVLSLKSTFKQFQHQTNNNLKSIKVNGERTIA